MNESARTPSDPESEACLARLTEVIDWELAAQIGAGLDLTVPEFRVALSQFVADTILDSFVVRPRESPHNR